jgi:hypothetical protein
MKTRSYTEIESLVRNKHHRDAGANKEEKWWHRGLRAKLNYCIR